MTPAAPRVIARAQDRLLKLLGSAPEGRSALVAGMLRRDVSEATSYWLQLVVSIGIATMGLVLGSTAIVIGAMLVAPLMGPIVHLAMGLAAGSPFLVLRSGARIALSVIAGIAGAAVITLLLPFHELNSEIAARTSPTLLDLTTAAFCALAGVYASLRPGSDTATTAAGTAISVSLIPPLCASGYSIGTRAWQAAGGAALLFLTNLVAIIAVGTVVFVAAGFVRVNAAVLEREELKREIGEAARARALARRLSRVFESRWGPVLRFLMPFVLLAVVYVPLRRALDEVAWQVRVRALVKSSIAQEALRVIESRVRVERHEVEVVMVIVGNTADAQRARERLDAEIRHASGVAPHIEVLAVPDATAFAGLKSTLLTPRAVKIPPREPSADEQLSAARTMVHAAVIEVWPSSAAGEPLVIEIGTARDGPLRIRVVHFGPPLAPDAAEALRRAIAGRLGREAVLLDVAVPPGELTRADGDLPFIARVSSAVRVTAGVPEVSVCVTRPAQPPAGRETPATDVELGRAVDQVLASHPRVNSVASGAWSVRFVAGSCPVPPPPDAGASDAAAR